MDTTQTAKTIIAAARRHVGEGAMPSSAALCLSDAEALLSTDPRAAAQWALRSLAYSVGILHADHRSAAALLA